MCAEESATWSTVLLGDTSNPPSLKGAWQLLKQIDVDRPVCLCYGSCMVTANISPRERILEKAGELFYRQGYNGTGINQIIEESGVAKATFYSHFKSKEELCIAYLEDVSAKEFALVTSTLEKKRSALARYLAPFEVLEDWLEETHYRGCPFLNIASEVPDERSPIRRVGVNFYTEHKRLVEQLVRELKADDSRKYGGLQPEKIAERYMMILVGMIGLCEIFQSGEPFREGLRLVQGLVEAG